MKAMARLLAACLACFAAACGAEPTTAGGPNAPEPIVVAAASSLTDVMEAIGDLYAADGNPEPRFSFAATSELVRQIEQGAQADVFISADAEWMDYLAEKKLIAPGSRKTVATNTLVLVAPAGKAFDIAMRPGMNLRAALGDGRVAIANPDGVPAGKYAREALTSFGAWDALEGVMARTENVRAALRFVEVGEAAAAIVYETDALAAGDNVVIVGRFPAGSHTPIVYPAAAVTEGSAQRAGAFLDYLVSDRAKAVFAEAGFGSPE